MRPTPSTGMASDRGPASSTQPAAGNNGGRPRPLLFEVSWEVCSQAGGIYTVLRSKAPSAVRRWGDGYYLIGPYREAAAKIELEPEPAEDVVADVVKEVESAGVRIHTGRWIISGKPRVLLVDVGSAAKSLGEMKYFFWKDIGVGLPDWDGEVDENTIFGYTVADLLSRIRGRMGSRPMMAHFHEWQAAVAMPILKHRQVHFPTVFTTHATLVGRSLSTTDVRLYDNLADINAEAVADERNFGHRFRIERAAAQAADVLTTVSDITGLEAEHFLGRKPEALLPNGLNVERFAAPYEFQNLHRQNKDLIHEFVMGHFFPSYTFDLDKTLYIFTAGRYEYRNKGFDVFIESLYELNNRLKADPFGVTVVAFIIAPAPYRALNVATLNSQAMFNELRETCERIKEDMGRRLFHKIAEGKLPETDDLLDEYAKVRLTRMMHAWRRQFQPTIVTHDLVDDWKDPILCHLRHRHLLNARTDPVKVVFHPEFITSTSPVLGLEYDQFVRGCNLGVFPSYYEPWGYTPMECVIRGIPAITSDLSGFGKYVMDHFPGHEGKGVFVAHRREAGFDSTVMEVTNWLHTLTKMSRRERIQLRNDVEGHAEHFDWNNLARYYREARRMGFAKYYPGVEVIPPDEEAMDAPAQSADATRIGRRRTVRGRAPEGGVGT
jgi:glycogen synthase